MEQLVWLVPLLPLISFLLVGLANRKLPVSVTNILACGSVLGSFIVSCILFYNQLHSEQVIQTKVFDWMKVGNWNISFSFVVDHLSSLFLMIITGVGFLIHLYSTSYMKGDDGYRRYFAYLNLFVFFMLLLVLGDNYLVMFVGWEGVGLCSYLLIGFWFKNKEYSSAAKKAFIMNRIGDLGFLMGMLLILVNFGSLGYQEVFNQAGTVTSNSTMIVLITLFLFIGATGKSAQIPLYTWLPDAMAGPTPVSALIHAATMVTAGIYMIARSNALYFLAPMTMEIVAVIGLGTALFAASIGIFQNDIKKVLAYSTVSQLGYMFIALGVGAFTSGIFHVMTHAFFKALLFLGAGSVIHGVHGQDIREMGGLKKHMPITHATFLIGTIAISGIPPLAGFFSKDEIMAFTFQHSWLYWALALAGSMMTAFYMFRLYFLTFHGSFRGDKHTESHIHESPSSMTIPLIILAVLACVAGFAGLPHIIGHHWLGHYLHNVFGPTDATLSLSAGTEWMLMGISVAAALIMIVFAYNKFVAKKSVPAPDEAITGFGKIAYNKYYVDELYTELIQNPLNKLGVWFHNFVETKIIDGLVNACGRWLRPLGAKLRLVQSGNLGFYVIAMVTGIIIILIFTIYKAGI